jgi:glycosyltransferase involved in cell wall biosynthesis
MAQKILLFSPFIYPEPISTGKYNTYLVKALVREGFSVEVIAYHPFYPEWRYKKTDASLENVKIIRGGFLPYAKSIVLRRIQIEFGFALHSLRHLLFNRNFNFAILVFPPMLFSLLIRFVIPRKVKKVGIVHDIQGVMAGVADKFVRKSVLRVIKIFEEKVFKMCDKLIFLSNSMSRRAILEYNLETQKIFVCYPFATIKKDQVNNNLDHLFAHGYKHVVYSGALGEKQNPHQLLKLFQQVVSKRTDIICHIFSRGPLFEDLKKKCKKKIGRILFHDLVPEENLYELYLRSDIQVIPQKKGTSTGAIPSKIPNIISAGAPTFAICEPESDLSRIISESGIGYYSDSLDINKLVVELNNLLEASSLQTHFERQQMTSEFVTRNFGIDRLIQLIAE